MHDCSVLYSLSLSLCSFYTARMTSQASRVGIRTNVHEHPLRATCTSFGRFRCGTVYTLYGRCVQACYTEVIGELRPLLAAAAAASEVKISRACQCTARADSA